MRKKRKKGKHPDRMLPWGSKSLPYVGIVQIRSGVEGDSFLSACGASSPMQLSAAFAAQLDCTTAAPGLQEFPEEISRRRKSKPRLESANDAHAHQINTSKIYIATFKGEKPLKTLVFRGVQDWSKNIFPGNRPTALPGCGAPAPCKRFACPAAKP